MWYYTVYTVYKKFIFTENEVKFRWFFSAVACFKRSGPPYNIHLISKIPASGFEVQRMPQIFQNHYYVALRKITWHISTGQ